MVLYWRKNFQWLTCCNGCFWKPFAVETSELVEILATLQSCDQSKNHFLKGILNFKKRKKKKFSRLRKERSAWTVFPHHIEKLLFTLLQRKILSLQTWQILSVLASHFLLITAFPWHYSDQTHTTSFWCVSVLQIIPLNNTPQDLLSYSEKQSLLPVTELKKSLFDDEVTICLFISLLLLFVFFQKCLFRCGTDLHIQSPCVCIQTHTVCLRLYLTWWLRFHGVFNFFKLHQISSRFKWHK